jgi:integrase/recombinase XerC
MLSGVADAGRARLGRRARRGGRHAPLRLRPADLRGAVADARLLPFPEALRIRGKGGKERDVPVLPAARAAVARYAALCPMSRPPGTPLFRGIRGGPLGPRAVARVMERTRLQLGLPASATPHALRHSFATHL